MTAKNRIFLSLAALAIGLFALLVGSGWLLPYAGHYVHGADVSRHQGPIDWTALARTDVRFVYIKATEGADFRDERFQSNWQGAGKAGIKRGAYHFFTLCRPGVQQAENFIATAPRGELPPVIDIEQRNPCREGPTMSDVVGEVSASLDRMEAHYGVRPLIYTTREFHDKHFQGALREEKFWLRNLFAQPDFRRDDWLFWQYSHDGRRPGVSGPLDLNYFRGDEQRFAAFLAKQPK